MLLASTVEQCREFTGQCGSQRNSGEITANCRTSCLAPIQAIADSRERDQGARITIDAGDCGDRRVGSAANGLNEPGPLWIVAERNS